MDTQGQGTAGAVLTNSSIPHLQRIHKEADQTEGDRDGKLGSYNAKDLIQG